MTPLTACKLAALIYEDWDACKAEAALLGFDGFEYWDHADTQAMLVYNKAEAALVFRGTEARKARWRDLVSNFGYPVVWAGEGRVHSGYLHHFNRIRDDALRAAMATPSCPHVVGHSMGGCLATLFAAWASITPARLWTFGAPKALDLKATAAIHCPISRYVNNHDFAPHWPPVPGLIHPARAIEIDSGGWPGPVTRHGTGRYLAALERLRPPRSPRRSLRRSQGSAYLDP